MKHPIYKIDTDRQMIQVMGTYGFDKFLETIKPTFNGRDNEAKAYSLRVQAMLSVAQNGHNLIQLRDAKHWDETLSEKTLMQMRVVDIKLPYPAFTIDLSSAEWTKYEYVQVWNMDGNLNFCFELSDTEGHRYHNMTLSSEELLEREVDRIVGVSELQTILKMLGSKKELDMQELRGAIYKVISIIMFTSMFQKVTDKVELIKTVNKGSKKRVIPNHTTAIVYLSQPSYRLFGKEKNGTRSSSEKTWMQKGHFRRQPYGSRSAPKYKSIWIDAMWKGSGSKVLDRVIKV